MEEAFEELFGGEKNARLLISVIMGTQGWTVRQALSSFGHYKATYDPDLDIATFVNRWEPVIERVLAGGEA